MFSHFARRTGLTGLFAVACVTLATTSFAAPLNVLLGFSSLPSAQGFTYVPSGSHAGVLESSIFSVTGLTLSQNSIGQANGTAGGSIFYQRLNGITTTESKQLRVRARCISAQGTTGNPTAAGGFIFGFTTGSVQYDFGITPTQVCVLTSAGQSLVPGTFDNATQFHDYVLDWTTPTSYRIYRDGALIYTGSPGFAVTANRIFFGDGTGGANALGEIRGFQFVQNLATPASRSTWGRLKALGR